MSVELGQRAVACKHWRWMPGMLAVDTDDGCTHRVACVTRSGYPLGCLPQDGGRVWELGANELPALTDPATLGCLLALVREVWGDSMLSAHYISWLGLWEMIPMDNNRRPLGQMCGVSEAEALVLALEAAP